MYDVILFGDMPDLQTYSRSAGCHRIATEVREHGYSVLVVDFSNFIDYDRFKQIVELAVGDNTLVVGFSTTWFPFILPDKSTSQREPSKPSIRFNHESNNTKECLSSEFATTEIKKYVDLIKNINSKTKVILGGAKVFMYTHAPVDACFIGHSETMIIDYLNSLSGRTLKRIFNKIIDYDKKAQSPVWDFRKSKISYEPESFILSSETLLLEVGRGCRFNCKFCSYPLIGQKNISDYLKFEECLYHELLDNYNKWGTTKYIIVDDTFNDSTEKLQMMKRIVDRLPFTPIFWCYMRIDLIVADPSQIELAKQIGVREVYFGIETLNREAGKVIGKGLDPKKITNTLEKCWEVWGSEVWIETGLICGLPKDTVETFEKSCEYFNREDRPVGAINVTPLRIVKHSDFTKHRFNAEFEINAEKYGYEFPNDVMPWKWLKHDGTDIESFEKASKIAIKWHKKLTSYIKLYKHFFYVSCIENLDYNELMKLNSYEELTCYLKDQDIKKLMRDQIEKKYFDPLLRFLKTRKC